VSCSTAVGWGLANSSRVGSGQQQWGGDWPTYGLIPLCWDQSWTIKIMAYNGWLWKVKILNTEIHNESFMLLWITCSRLELVTKVHTSLTSSTSNMLMLSCEFCIQTYYVTIWATDCTDMVNILSWTDMNARARTHTHTHTHTHTSFSNFLVITIRYCKAILTEMQLLHNEWIELLGSSIVRFILQNWNKKQHKASQDAEEHLTFNVTETEASEDTFSCLEGQAVQFVFQLG
jgi:hypothetical protein